MRRYRLTRRKVDEKRCSYCRRPLRLAALCCLLLSFCAGCGTGGYESRLDEGNAKRAAQPAAQGAGNQAPGGAAPARK